MSGDITINEIKSVTEANLIIPDDINIMDVKKYVYNNK